MYKFSMTEPTTSMHYLPRLELCVLQQMLLKCMCMALWQPACNGGCGVAQVAPFANMILFYSFTCLVACFRSSRAGSQSNSVNPLVILKASLCQKHA
jgi:hypothetical protein